MNWYVVGGVFAALRYLKPKHAGSGSRLRHRASTVTEMLFWVLASVLLGLAAGGR